jgi:putative heme iron utilization protein
MAQTQEPRDFVKEAAILLAAARVGTLATVSDGLPHAALVTPAVAADGGVLLLLSELSAHTRHLQANPACSLLVAGVAASENPQTAPRLTLAATAAVTSDPAARAIYLATHPYASLYVDFLDFAFWRLEVAQAHYVGGFAAAAALDVAALRNEINGAIKRLDG